MPIEWTISHGSRLVVAVAKGELTPEHMRGRVASLLPVFPAFISVGALLAGICADLMGPQVVVIVLALIALSIIGTAWARSSALRGVRLSGLIAGGNK